MEHPPTELSPAAFDHLIARAIDIDDDGRERLNLLRARDIATEMGISSAAWDAALRERQVTMDVLPELDAPTFHWMQPLVSAGLGLAAGGLAQDIIRTLGPDELYWFVIGAGALGIGLYGEWRRMERKVHFLFAVWWLALLGGLTISFGHLPSLQALLLVIPVWAGATLVSGAVMRLLRRGASFLIEIFRGTA